MKDSCSALDQVWTCGVKVRLQLASSADLRERTRLATGRARRGWSGKLRLRSKRSPTRSRRHRCPQDRPRCPQHHTRASQHHLIRPPHDDARARRPTIATNTICHGDDSPTTHTHHSHHGLFLPARAGLSLPSSFSLSASSQASPSS